MEVKIITIAIQQKNLIKHICALANECATNYKTLSILGKILKFTHILFLISLVREEDINLLTKKEVQKYKEAINWVWIELRTIGNNIVTINVDIINHKINKEDLSKLSKEELIARLKEATK